MCGIVVYISGPYSLSQRVTALCLILQDIICHSQTHDVVKAYPGGKGFIRI